MSEDTKRFPRGSEWRVWDLHIHTPASFHWCGERLSEFSDPAASNRLLDTMITAMNEAEPAVFALMDYWTFDGWFALKKRLLQSGAPRLRKTVFPGIELRLAAPMNGRLNAHVIFSNEISDQSLIDFKSHLVLELIRQPLSNPGLIVFARNANADKLAKHGFKKSEVMASEDIALKAGAQIAEASRESYKDAILKVPLGQAVGFMPFDTYDGLSRVKWDEHYSYSLDLFQSSPIFETRDPDCWAAFAGLRTEGNAEWFVAFRAALKNVSRLAVSGSDAHRFRGSLGNNNERGYGDFPSSTKTWIKADPTWLGLLQAIKEPENRSYIGLSPPKLDLVRQNKAFYIDNITVERVAGEGTAANWLHGCDIPLSTDLVAIIGNKGSGKSALADIIALLGDSQQKAHFSFLKRERFRGKAGEPARQFKGRLNWYAGQPGEMLLSDDPPPNRVELVKYIPQGRFEALCNDHVTGRADTFENELRSVIFSHVDASVSIDALDFDQLIEAQESGFRAKLNELRKTLRAINESIVSIEDQLNPNARITLEEQLTLKEAELAQHLTLKPVPVPEPTGALSAEQQSASKRLAEIAAQLTLRDSAIKLVTSQKQGAAVKRRSVRNVKDRANILANQFREFANITSANFQTLGLAQADFATLTINDSLLRKVETEIEADELAADAQIATNVAAKLTLEAEQKLLGNSLNEPQQIFQKYLAELKIWEARRDFIEGTNSSAENLNGLKARLSQLDQLPATLFVKKELRAAVTKDIFGVLSTQRAARAALFLPLQRVIEGNALVRDNYKLQFQATLYGSPAAISSRLFDFVKRTTGELRGEEESDAAVRSRFDKYDFTTADDAVAFADDIIDMIENAGQQSECGIRSKLKRDKQPVDVYDYIFGVNFLEPKYTLLFQDARIEQLSPGQRGALLLIFYLLVDKGRNPIVLDQPEENLDNETVVRLLVPVVNEAKKSRQIVMVTHNPNLAVVCDAEQIIYAEFDRKSGAKISYCSGAIEDPKINKFVVDVLEGTKPAFDNRGDKYHPQTIG